MLDHAVADDIGQLMWTHDSRKGKYTQSLSKVPLRAQEKVLVLGGAQGNK